MLKKIFEYMRLRLWFLKYVRPKFWIVKYSRPIFKSIFPEKVYEELTDLGVYNLAIEIPYVFYVIFARLLPADIHYIISTWYDTMLRFIIIAVFPQLAPDIDSINSGLSLSVQALLIINVLIDWWNKQQFSIFYETLDFKFIYFFTVVKYYFKYKARVCYKAFIILITLPLFILLWNIIWDG